MSLWTKDTPPTFQNPKSGPAVATAAGWVDPNTGEVLVAISNLTTKAGAADVLTTRFENGSYIQGQALKVFVHYNEKVDVVVGATIEASWSGPFGNVTLTAPAQIGTYDVRFDGVVPSEAGTLSVAAQTLLGTVTDNLGGAPSNVSISSVAGAAAGTRPVA